ncbi:nuclear pore complex assembly domain-containing protein [Phthorimaea operculella]|nr:nuclear pore complex assembly domain-containing protein [Phthorimaea operculella]
MQKLQDSVFSIVKTTNLSPAVFSYLQPSEDFPDKTPLGGILNDTKHGWLALGPKFCVVDLRTGLKIAQRTFGASLSNFRTTVTCVVELPTSVSTNSTQLLISLECEDIAGMICVFHINGSQILRCIQTEFVVTELAVCDGFPDGPFTCFDGAVMAGTKTGEIFVFDLNRSGLVQALKDISQGYEHMVRSEENSANITFLPLNAVGQLETQRDLAVENDDHIAVLLNENSIVEGNTYIFRNPDGTVRMKARRDHVRVTVIQYIPQLGSLAVGFNFGAFQLWNLLNLDLEFTSQVNVECLPVTHFGFQEPCDDPRAFCYLWVIFSVLDRFEEEEFPFAVMYSLTYQGKRMLSDTKCLYQEFLSATIRFQMELTTTEEASEVVGGRCVSCHTYSVNSNIGGEGEESMLNICQLVWECWGENASASSQYGMLLFDLDQWYKDQMPATYPLQSCAFMSATRCSQLARGATATLDARLVPSSVSVYCAATRLEEHFFPNSLRYECICLNTSEACVLHTTGIQRQIINSLDEVGPTALLNPTRLYHACVQVGLVPLYMDNSTTTDQEEQRRYLLSVALEARLSRFLKRCARDWAAGSHIGAGCTLNFLVDWCWKRAIELKENARELTAPLFTSSTMPDRNVTRCLEHCVQQLTQLTGLLDAILTKCCNLVVPDALSEMEEKYKGIGTVSLYFQVVQWFLRVGLLPERQDSCTALSYPGEQLINTYNKRRVKLHRLQDHNMCDENAAKKSCPLLYIDQLIEEEFGGDRIHQMWIRGGSETNGLYPPPSLYSLLRLYLLPDIAEEHKHSLVLYLLVDYSMVYDEVRYETVIRRLMQFPTMFGLSNTAIKATQAFWHLDHRDFDFALDQLQCLTGNNLSYWQHGVVLSSLLAQKKTQAALQYLHVRKPPPPTTHANLDKVNDNDKLEDWQSCCNLYLARGLVFEALDVIRMCVQNAPRIEDKAFVLNFFFKSCRNTGQLSKLLQATLLPFEEDVFIKYLENCNEPQTSDILIMYYLQQSRYLEAEQYNKRIKQSKPRAKDYTTSIESLTDLMDREGARDTLVEVLCGTLPAITNTVAHSINEKEWESHIFAPKPMSVFIQAKSPKNTFVYKSSFIQDTIENASETWINRPKARKGLKRALNIEETPFICTPKLNRSKSIFNLEQNDSTPPKRARLDLTGTPRTPHTPRAPALQIMSQQLSELLDMPDLHSPDMKYDRGGAETPHSILKIRTDARGMAVSPVDSRYLGDSDDELLETASNHTHYSDSTNKHLRFTIPTASESGSTPSPTPQTSTTDKSRRERDSDMTKTERGKEPDVDMSLESFATTESHAMNEANPLESPPKKVATEEKCESRKKFKDSVRARRSLSISANSSLSDDPNTSIESIADIPITLINVRYSGEKRRSFTKEKDTENEESTNEEKASETLKGDVSKTEVPKTPRGRRSIRPVSAESTPLLSSRSRSVTPERLDSPVAVVTPLRPIRNTRSRSRTPEISPRSSPLSTIPEQPKQEVESEPHPARTTLSVPRRTRSRSRTPERIEKVVESPRLEAITESPTKSSDSPTSSPVRRSLRSRSRTPEVEPEKTAPASPRTLRSRAKTPEKLMSPKKDAPKSSKKPLSRLVLEANAIAASKNLEKQIESKEEKKEESAIECTPMKSLKSAPSLMDVTISPIVSKSILHSSSDSVLSESIVKENKTAEDDTLEMKSLPAFTMNETKFGKSVLHSYESSMEEVTQKETNTEVLFSASKLQKSIPAFTLSESYFQKSVLHSYTSSVGETSVQEEKSVVKESPASSSFNITDFNKSVLASHETSLAESQDKKDKNMSSLITDDSEMEDSKAEKRQEVEQKEKEKIVDEGVERDSSDSEECEDTEEPSDDIEDDSGKDSSALNDSDPLKSENAEEEEEEIISLGDSDESNHNMIIDEDLNIGIGRGAKGIKIIKLDKAPTEDSNEGESTSESNEGRSASDSNEASTDPLNQAQMSVLTDDNSVQTDSKLADESKVEKATETTKDTDSKLPESKVQEDAIETPKEKTQESVEGSTNPLDQAQISLMTNDDSVLSDTSEAKLKYSDEEKVEKSGSKDKPELAADIEMKPVEKSTFQIQVTVEAEHIEADIPEMPKPTENMEVSEQTADVVDANAGKTAHKDKGNQVEKVSEKHDIEMKDDAPKIDVKMQSSESESTAVEEGEKTAPRGKKRTKSTSSTKSNQEDSTKVVETKLSETESKSEDTADESGRKPARRATRRTKSTSSNKSIKDESTTETKSPDTESGDTAPEDIGKPATRTKRTRSTASNKSRDETAEPKTPVTRKRSQSVASNKSEEQKTPEENVTPSRRRAKTPTSTTTTSSTGAEVRRILTRRASKELNQSVLDDSSIEDSSLTTPKRRSARTRSTNIDDNASVVSGDSVRSTRSRASRASEDGDSKPQRKGKKSILAAAKPDLSVIPESAVEDSKADSKGEIIADYSSSRRLTRHQKSLLESWLEPKPSPSRRRPSTTTRASVTSLASDQEVDEDDASSTHSGAFDVQPIDRISLLNKGDFEGSPDSSEVQSNISPESIASDASKQRRARLDRAGSESRSTPKARSIRRVSVDVAADTSVTGSPGAGTPSRGRRASFTRAVEALHTPKGRRTSTDIKRGENDSVTSSPPVSESSPPATPSRRPRRGSTASNTSKLDTSVTGTR